MGRCIIPEVRTPARERLPNDRLARLTGFLPTSRGTLGCRVWQGQ